MTCSVEGCEGNVHGHGLCSRHYTKRRRYGDPLHQERRYHKDLPPAERFWAYVEKGAGPGACWEWTGGKISTGYGLFYLAPQKRILAHRFSYKLRHGTIPRRLQVLHHCDNRGCVNPRHLFCGTQQNNVDDMINKGRDRKRGLAGAENHRARLTEASVRKIRASTMIAKILARQHGVSVSLIYAIRQRRLWAHVQ